MRLTNVYVLLLFSVGIQLGYFCVTGPFARSYDVEGHLDHIDYVARHLSIPAAKEGWECYHPPVYYFIGGILKRILQTFGINNGERWLQLLSLVIFNGFLLLSIVSFRDTFRDTKSQIISTCFLLFWPTTPIHAVRIGNDVGFYFFHAAAIFCLLHYKSAEKSRPLYWAAGLACLAVMTKANGFVTMAIVYTRAALSVFTHNWRSRTALKTFATANLILGLGAVLFGLVTWLKGGAVSNAGGLPSSLLVGKGLRNFCWLDLQAYFRSPFLDPMDDATGRQYFWNYFLKSSVTGEWPYPNPITNFLVPILEGLLFLVLAYCLIGFFVTCFVRELNVWLLNALFLLGAIIVYRWLEPYSCSGDFRYVFPLIGSGAVFYANAIEFFLSRNQRLFAWFGWSLLGLFLVLSYFCVISLLLYN
jgi:hypothetical protein